MPDHHLARYVIDIVRKVCSGRDAESRTTDADDNVLEELGPLADVVGALGRCAITVIQQTTKCTRASHVREVLNVLDKNPVVGLGKLD